MAVTKRRNKPGLKSKSKPEPISKEISEAIESMQGHIRRIDVFISAARHLLVDAAADKIRVDYMEKMGVQSFTCTKPATSITITGDLRTTIDRLQQFSI